MLRIRIIPCLDVLDGRIVKGVNFVNLKNTGDPVLLATRYASLGADEIVFLDISATHKNYNLEIDIVKKIAKMIFIPFTVGGGIKTLENIRNILNAGADKIAINSFAVKNPEIIRIASNKFGRQCIVVAIDVKMSSKTNWNVFIHGGRIDTGLDVVYWAQEVVRLGAGEILLTSMDRDGTKRGYDLNLLRTVSNFITIPIIASGGAGKVEDFARAYENGASAMLVASLFHYKELTIYNIKKYLKSQNIPVRMIN
ncbi:MAG: imidazole glycerol phosphate synthase subunit HisF [Endomicrobium sp.]|jgi:cyclase|nr:imidazole glycerol phosphate synthase subunit HisF [Endomicrobium sp.]